MAAIVAALAGFLVGQTHVALAEAGGAPARQCPGYESLMRAAAESLRAGDRSGALQKLREARSALDACANQARSGSQIG